MVITAKYTEKGSITFSAKGLQTEDGFSLVISVEDTGIGIREEDIGKLLSGILEITGVEQATLISME